MLIHNLNKKLESAFFPTTIKESNIDYIYLDRNALKVIKGIESNKYKEQLEEVYYSKILLLDDIDFVEFISEHLKNHNINAFKNFKSIYTTENDINVIKVSKNSRKILGMLYHKVNNKSSELAIGLWDLYSCGFCKISDSIKNILIESKVKFKESVLYGFYTKIKKIFKQAKFKASIVLHKWQLVQMQGLSLDGKIRKTLQRIKEWYEYWDGNVYVSLSGGKDSTVLLYLVRSLYPDVPAVYVDTGLEYPEIRNFVKTIDNVIWLKPDIPFTEVLKKYGYPVVSKEVAAKIKKLTTQNLTEEYRNYLLYGDERGKAGKLPEKWKILLNAPFKISDECCRIMKKKPIYKFERKSGLKSFIGVMAEESKNREDSYLQNGGCNAFYMTHPTSRPLGFWLEQDILKFIVEKNIQISSVYGEIKEDKNGLLYTTKEKRTGCMYCAMGCHLEKKPNRFQRMAVTHPYQYNYCINKLNLGKVLNFIGVDYTPMSLFKCTNEQNQMMLNFDII